MSIISIKGSNPFNIFFKQDGIVVVDQCHDTTAPQRFKYSDIVALIASDPTIIDRPLPKPTFTDERCQGYKAQCEAWLNPRRHRGFIWNDLPVPADQEAQANFSSVLNLIQLGAPGPFLLHDNDNVDHLLTIAEVQDLSMNMAAFVQGCYQACWAAKAEIDEAETTDECEEALETLNLF